MRNHLTIKRFCLLSLVAACCLAGCEKDNYDPPKAQLSGALTYQGDSIGLSYDDVVFQLWQPGFGKLTPIEVTVNQEGVFSALLFKGDYKLVIPPGQGPFTGFLDSASDTLDVHVEGDRTMDIEVQPYYMIHSPQFELAGTTIQAHCSIAQIVKGPLAKPVEQVALYIGKTRFLDTRTALATARVKGADLNDLSAVALEKPLPKMTPEQDYVFVRLGVKIQSVEDMIFSRVVRINY